MKTTTTFRKVCFSAAVVVATSTIASAQDWSGAYAGLAFSNHSGEGTDYLNGVIIDVAPDSSYTNPYTRTGSMTNIFGGYRLHNGNFVYGPEFQLSNGSLKLEGLPNNKVVDYQVIKFNAGYATGELLFYGGFGYFKGTMEPNCLAVCGAADIKGPVLSVGIDYLVYDNFTIGALISQRQYKDSVFPLLEETDPGYTVDGKDTSFELRVGYNF